MIHNRNSVTCPGIIETTHVSLGRTRIALAGDRYSDTHITFLKSNLYVSRSYLWFCESCQNLIWYQISFEWRLRHTYIIIFSPSSSESIYHITNPLVNSTKSYFLRLLRPVTRRQVLMSTGYFGSVDCVTSSSSWISFSLRDDPFHNEIRIRCIFPISRDPRRSRVIRFELSIGLLHRILYDEWTRNDLLYLSVESSIQRNSNCIYRIYDSKKAEIMSYSWGRNQRSLTDDIDDLTERQEIRQSFCSVNFIFC